MVHKVLFWSGFGASTFSRKHRDRVLTKAQALPSDFGSSASRCARCSNVNPSGHTACTPVWELRSVTG